VSYLLVLFALAQVSIDGYEQAKSNDLVRKADCVASSAFFAVIDGLQAEGVLAGGN
jgi:hypothetical protein